MHRDITRRSDIVTEQERSLAIPTRHRPSHAIAGTPNFFIRGPHKLLHNSSRAGHLT